jgi:hypothetical protein
MAYKAFPIFHENYPKMGEILHQLRAAMVIGDPRARERLSRFNHEPTGFSP